MAKKPSKKPIQKARSDLGPKAVPKTTKGNAANTGAPTRGTNTAPSKTDAKSTQRVIQNTTQKPAPKTPAKLPQVPSSHAVKPTRKQTHIQTAAPVRTEVVRASFPEPAPEKPGVKLRVFMLGGQCEIGKNLCVLEYGDDIILIDCGLAFPDDDMLGIDLVIPEDGYLIKNANKIRGILLTHGHEDHIGALPYILRDIQPPVYGTRLTLGILENKLEEAHLKDSVTLNTVSAGDVVQLGAFSAEFIHVNHSIADACCIAVTTPVGVVLHSGDFKIDPSPMDSELIDLTRIGEYGKKGVLLFLCESTNVGRPGYTPSERTVGASLDGIFLTHPDKRIVIATFSSNVHRVQQIVNASVKYDRKVAITGRSMKTIIGAAKELGYMNIPDGVLIDIEDIKRYPGNKITIVTTGSQGEPMSALYRMAFSDHKQVELNSGDLVVLSAHAIPGNETDVGNIINEMYRRGVSVYHSQAEVHVSGHACQEEIKLMHSLVRPKYFMPIHGEYSHLMQHKELAEFMGMDPKNIFVMENGQVLELDKNGGKRNGKVLSGIVMVDGAVVGDVGSVVLRDRKHLAEDGLIVVVATVDADMRQILSGPDIVSRGFIYVKESENLMEDVRIAAYECLERDVSSGVDQGAAKQNLRDELSHYLFSRTKRKPMILPVIMNI